MAGQRSTARAIVDPARVNGGESPWLRAGKGSAYEGGVRVPLIVKWPGITRPGSVDTTTPVISVDFLPTVLDIAGVPAAGRPSSDGESLVPSLRGEVVGKDRALFWHYPHYHTGGATPYSAIRDGDWKLIHFFEDDRVELYNLGEDIGETRDLAQAHAVRTSKLRAKLDAWRKQVGAQMPTKNPAYDPARQWERIRGGGAKKEDKK